MLAALLLVIAQDPGALPLEGRCVALSFAPKLEPVAAEALAAAETAWPIAARLLGEERLAPATHVPLELRVDAPLDALLLERIGVPMSARAALVREVAAEVATRLVPANPSFPDWLRDGLATWVEEETLVALELASRPEDEPRAATRLHIARRVLEGGRLPSVADLIAGRTDGLAVHEEQALYAALFRLLADDGDRFQTLSTALRRIPGGRDYPKHVASTLDGIWKAIDLDARLATRLERAAPAWEVCAGDLWRRDGALVQLAGAEDEALAWRVPPSDASLAGSLEFLATTPQAARVCLDRHALGWLAITFRPGSGVAISEYDVGRGKWRSLRSADIALSRGEPIPFRIEWSDGELRVDVRGERACAVRVERAMTGAWGLGVEERGAVAWSGLR